MPFSKGSSRPGDRTQVSYNAGRILVGELRSHMLQSLYIYMYNDILNDTEVGTPSSHSDEQG